MWAERNDAEMPYMCVVCVYILVSKVIVDVSAEWIDTALDSWRGLILVAKL